VAGETTPIKMLKLPPAHTWRCKTYEGASWEQIDPPEELLDLSIRATRRMGLTYAALDILPHPSGGWVILEVNAVPGFLNMFGEPGNTEGLAGIFDWVEKQLGSLSEPGEHSAEVDHG
jgi:ribosomal protein S6--L-glutamate ligase